MPAAQVTIAKRITVPLSPHPYPPPRFQPFKAFRRFNVQGSMFKWDPFKGFRQFKVQRFKTTKIGGRDPEPGFYFLTLLPQL